MTHKILISRQLIDLSVPVLTLDGKVAKEIKLPAVFSYPVRKDLIKRAFHSALTARIQPQGRDPLAGKRRVGESWGINHSVARVPRLDNGRAVFAPMTRGGRLAHPPRTEKVIHEEINKKERIRALASAIAATASRELVKERGHIYKADVLPIIVIDELESVRQASEAKRILMNLGVWDDVLRAYERRRIRAGKGKMRGRKHVVPKSVLIVHHSLNPPALKAFRNFPGVDIISVDILGVMHLAPGGVPGRLTVFTESALKKLSEKFEVMSYE